MSAPQWKMRGNFLSHPMELIKVLGTFEGGMVKEPHWVQKMHVPVLHVQELIKVLITAGFTSICKKELIKVLITAGFTSICKKELIKVLIMAGCSSICKKELIEVLITAGFASICKKELIKLLGVLTKVDGECAPLDGRGVEVSIVHVQGAHKTVWKRRGVPPYVRRSS
jgi:hypothetical protein